MKLSNLGKKMIIVIVAITSFSTAASAIYYRSIRFLPFMFGLLLGASVSIAKVFLLERTVDRLLSMEKNAAKNYASLHHILRLLFTAIVLVLGALVTNINIWGVAIGILAFQMALYSINLISKS